MTKDTSENVEKVKATAPGEIIPASPAVENTRPTTPATLIELAISKDADMEKLQALMDMQERWERREAEKAFTRAMSAFRSEPLEIEKDQKVSYQTDRGVVEYWHASLANESNVIANAMSKHGLSFRWTTEQDMQNQGRITVTCIVSHIDGHSDRVSLSASPDQSGGKNNIQAVGSTVSYLKRYTLESAAGAATYDPLDDDGATGGGSAGPELVSAEQVEQLRAKLKEIGADESRFCKVCKVESLDQLLADKFTPAMKKLESKANESK